MMLLSSRVRVSFPEIIAHLAHVGLSIIIVRVSAPLFPREIRAYGEARPSSSSSMFEAGPEIFRARAPDALGISRLNIYLTSVRRCERDNRLFLSHSLGARLPLSRASESRELLSPNALF